MKGFLILLIAVLFLLFALPVGADTGVQQDQIGAIESVGLDGSVFAYSVNKQIESGDSLKAEKVVAEFRAGTSLLSINETMLALSKPKVPKFVTVVYLRSLSDPGGRSFGFFDSDLSTRFG